MKISAGSNIVLTHGRHEYSDFNGPFLVLKDFDQADVAEAYTAQWKPKDEWERVPDQETFVAWMVAQGFLAELPCCLWHIGDYQFEPEIQQ